MRLFSIDEVVNRVELVEPATVFGKVSKVVGMVVEGYAPRAKVGSMCRINTGPGHGQDIKAEVVGFRGHTALLMPLGEIRGVQMGSTIEVDRVETVQSVGDGLLGRVIDGMGHPIDGRGPLNVKEHWPLYSDPTNPLDRAPIKEPLELGIRAMDGLCTLCKGQRMGIMSGSGVGKSVLLGMIARNTSADVKVIALIGERGREVKNFIDNNLTATGLENSVVIAAASDQPPLVRMRGAFVATAIAEYFRSQGKSVLLMMDSITRFAMAQREVGLAVGEPPTTKGYTPSVFSQLFRLMERAGTCSGKGAITGLYTVLVEGDDLNDPVADSARSILDGHVVLSRELAQRNVYPALDVTASISRVMGEVMQPWHVRLANRFREVLSNYAKAEDLINIGAYTKGNNAKIDEALEKIDAITDYIKQDMDKKVGFEESLLKLREIFPGEAEEENAQQKEAQAQ